VIFDEAVPPSRPAGHWEASLGVIVPAAILLVLLAQAFFRLRARRRDHPVSTARCYSSLAVASARVRGVPCVVEGA
jgi:hypothetical protein